MIGSLSHVEARLLGSEVVVAAAIGDTVIAVDFVADFNEDGGNLLLNGTTLAYTTVDPELELVTLAAPLAVAASISDVLQVIDPTGAPAVEWVAGVAVDDGDTVSAVIPSSLVPYFSEGTPAGPQDVLIEVAPAGYEVVAQPNADPVFDGAAVWNPYLTVDMGLATCANSTWVSLLSYTTTASQAMKLAAGVTTTTYGGRYMVMVRVAWAFNTTGRRGVRIMVDGVGAETELRPPDTLGQTYMGVSDLVTLTDTSAVTVECYQESGASLNMNVGTMSVFRVSV